MCQIDYAIKFYRESAASSVICCVLRELFAENDRIVLFAPPPYKCEG